MILKTESLLNFLQFRISVIMDVIGNEISQVAGPIVADGIRKQVNSVAQSTYDVITSISLLVIHNT